MLGIVIALNLLLLLAFSFAFFHSDVMKESTGCVAVTVNPTGTTASCTEKPVSHRLRYAQTSGDTARVNAGWSDRWMDGWGFNRIECPAISLVHLLIVFFKDEAFNFLPVIRFWMHSSPYPQGNPQRETWAPVSLLNLTENEVIIHFFAEFTVINCIVLHSYTTIRLICWCTCVVVCFLSDRDWLRERVIQWIREEVEADHLASSASERLHMYFKVRTSQLSESHCSFGDLTSFLTSQKVLKGFQCVPVLQMYDNGDSELDSKEFLSFLKHNETALNLTYSKSLETNSLLRCGWSIAFTTSRPLFWVHCWNLCSEV